MIAMIIAAQAVSPTDKSGRPATFEMKSVCVPVETGHAEATFDCMVLSYFRLNAIVGWNHLNSFTECQKTSEKEYGIAIYLML
jgi:hypothetical protein